METNTNSTTSDIKAGHNEDLMKRLSNFLPQMKVANEQLAVQQSTSDYLDAQLQVDADSDDEKDSSDTEEEQDYADKEAPIIELKLAVGDVEKNPVIELLADKEEEEEEEDDDDAEGERECTVAPTNKKEAVVNLLLKRPSPKNDSASRPLKKRPLITEIDEDEK